MCPFKNVTSGTSDRIWVKSSLKIQSSFKRDELQSLGTQLLLYLKKFWYHRESCSQYLASSSKLNSNIENIIFNLLLILSVFVRYLYMDTGSQVNLKYELIGSSMY